MNQNSNQKSAPTAKLVRLGFGAFITATWPGENLTIRAEDSQENFDRALSALKAEEWDSLYEAMRPVKSFASKVDGVTLDKNGVYFNGEPIHSVIASRIMDFALAGLDHKPLCLFLNKLMQNPSSRAVNELYTFLENQNIPLSDSGCFLGYKKVQSDWYSLTAGTAKLIQGTVKDGKIFNGINEVVEMERCKVDDDKEVGCSYGLHVGSANYAQTFGGNKGRVVIVEVNPKDVVSIPVDCNFQKLRTCKYKVVGEFTGLLTEPLYESRWQQDADDYDDVDTFEDDYCGCDDLNVDDIAECEAQTCTCHPKTQTRHNLRDNKGKFAPKTQPAKPKPYVHRDAAGHFAPMVDWFDTPRSSWVKRVKTYEDETVVITTQDGVDMVYSNVPRSVFSNFSNEYYYGKSAGQFYNQNIKNIYTRVQ